MGFKQRIPCWGPYSANHSLPSGPKDSCQFHMQNIFILAQDFQKSQSLQLKSEISSQFYQLYGPHVSLSKLSKSDMSGVSEILGLIHPGTQFVDL